MSRKYCNDNRLSCRHNATKLSHAADSPEGRSIDQSKAKSAVAGASTIRLAITPSEKSFDLEWLSVGNARKDPAKLRPQCSTPLKLQRVLIHDEGVLMPPKASVRVTARLLMAPTKLKDVSLLLDRLNANSRHR